MSNVCPVKHLYIVHLGAIMSSEIGEQYFTILELTLITVGSYYNLERREYQLSCFLTVWRDSTYGSEELFLRINKSTTWTWCTHRNQSQCMIYLFLVVLWIYISAINLLCLMSFDLWISWLAAIFGFFVHRLYVRLSSCENHVFQGLDALTPTLIVGNGMKVVSHVLVMFSVLCTVSLGCCLWVVAVLFY